MPKNTTTDEKTPPTSPYDQEAFNLDDDDDLLDLDAREDLITPGTYSAVIENVEMAFGPTGDPYYRVRFKLTGTGQGGDEASVGKTVSDIWSFSEKALSITRRSIRAILGGGPFRYKSEMDRLMGGACIVKIDHREYQGEPQNDVARIWPDRSSHAFAPAVSSTKVF